MKSGNEIQNKMICLIKKALKVLWEKDSELIIRDAHEECINHRLAIYLEKEFKELMKSKNLSLDIEYNKNGSDPKTYGSENKRFRPDIIIHERDSNYNNYLVIEAKKYNLNKNDKEKLKCCKNEPYNYILAIGLEYGIKKEVFTLYVYNKNGYSKEIQIRKY